MGLLPVGLSDGQQELVELLVVLILERLAESAEHLVGGVPVLARVQDALAVGHDAVEAPGEHVPRLPVLPGHGQPERVVEVLVLEVSSDHGVEHETLPFKRIAEVEGRELRRHRAVGPVDVADVRPRRPLVRRHNASLTYRTPSSRGRSRPWSGSSPSSISPLCPTSTRRRSRAAC